MWYDMYDMIKNNKNEKLISLIEFLNMLIWYLAIHGPSCCGWAISSYSSYLFAGGGHRHISIQEKSNNAGEVHETGPAACQFA